MTTWTDEQRDRWKRPLVRDLEDSTRSVGYTRATTFIKALDDSEGLIPWYQGLTALGLVERADLRNEVKANRDDVTAVRSIAMRAAEAAGATSAREAGQALHKMTQDVDEGHDPWGADEKDLADLDAYRRVTLGMEHLYIEQATVHDGYRIGGTPDRITRCPDGTVRIVDVKTGPSDEDRLEMKGLSWAAQLAVYAHSVIYDPITGERSPNPAETDMGYIVWLPAGQARAKLIEVDLVTGWEAVQVAYQVRSMRSKGKTLIRDTILPTALPDDLDMLRRLWIDGTPSQRRIVEAKVKMLQERS